MFGTLGWSGRNRKELYRWSMSDEPPRRLGLEYMPDYLQGAVSPDGSLLAISGHTVSTVRLIDTSLGLVVSTLHNEASTIDSLTFSPDGKQLLACDTAGVVLAWDLDRDQDLFKLRANPLGPLAGSGYALANDHSLLAIATVQDGVRLRRRDGHETILRPDDPTRARLFAPVKLRFSPDRRWLACESGADYATVKPPDVVIGGRTLRMFDTLTGLELWTVRLPEYRQPAELVPPANYGVPDFLPAEQWAFAADGSRLAALRGDQLYVIDVATGRVQSSPATLRERAARPSVSSCGTPPAGSSCWRCSSPRRRIWRRSAARRDQRRDLEPDAPAAGRADRRGRGCAGRQARGAGPRRHAARGSVGCVRGASSAADSGPVPGVQRRRQQVRCAGRDRQDRGRRARPLEARRSSQPVGGRRRPPARDAQPGGQRREQVQFSPDGRRLLTLHGKLALGAGGAVPEGRLWDVQSGREMMTLPVADVNHYLWELAFDPGRHAAHVAGARQGIGQRRRHGGDGV